MDASKKTFDEKPLDLEVQSFTPSTQEEYQAQTHSKRWPRLSFLEWTSIEPVSPEEQKQPWYLIPLLWCSVNVNVLTFSTGMLAAFFDLSLPASLYTILGFTLVCALVPAYFTTLGMRLGLRQLVHSRYAFGYVGTSALGLLSAATQLVYGIENCIIGGQTLRAVSPHESMSSVVGIVIIALASFAVCFFGIRVMHFVEGILWFPTLICFILLTALAGSGPDGLHIPQDGAATTCSGVLAYGCIVAGFNLSWATIASDVSLYTTRTTSVKKMFVWVYISFVLTIAPFFMLGAAFGIAAPHVPKWYDASQESSPGPLFNVILAGRSGNFGKFVTVLLALSAIGNIIPGIYSFGIAVQTSFPILCRLPRFVMSFVALAIILPCSIVGRDKFYDTLTDFSSILAYWCGMFSGITLADVCVLRRFNLNTYDVSIWKNCSRLPPGIAGIASFLIPIALIVPCMDQTWYTGPLAEHSGDLGFEVGIVFSFTLYLILRPLEKRIWH
ncbi:hypothetical protein MPSI1_003955 [Malassezia psittaci]|uniref:Uncharacterized protein n=1 Tax=Malassezia psittaci TaxID=1821823 RepID=A0AAF0F9T4_9BASI|nr:hypothetical protein MPSI1_003955 [Malassezia psittaci]